MRWIRLRLYEFDGGRTLFLLSALPGFIQQPTNIYNTVVRSDFCLFMELNANIFHYNRNFHFIWCLFNNNNSESFSDKPKTINFMFSTILDSENPVATAKQSVSWSESNDTLQLGYRSFKSMQEGRKTKGSKTTEEKGKSLFAFIVEWKMIVSSI